MNGNTPETGSQTSASRVTLNSWATLPKQIIQQLKYGESSLRIKNDSYNIENGALSIRKKNFPQLEVTIGSRTLERNGHGKASSSVVLEPLGKSDHLDIDKGVIYLNIVFIVTLLGLMQLEKFTHININLITFRYLWKGICRRLEATL